MLGSVAFIYLLCKYRLINPLNLRLFTHTWGTSIQAYMYIKKSEDTRNQESFLRASHPPLLLALSPFFSFFLDI